MRSRANHPSHRRGRGGPGGVHQGAFHLGPGGGSAGVHNSCGRVTSLSGQLPHAAVIAVELRPEGGQLTHPGGALGHEHVDGGPVAQAGARSQGVSGMQGHRVHRVQIVRTARAMDLRLGVMQDRRHPALRPLGGRVGQGAFGQHPDPETWLLGASSGGTQAGYPAAHDEQVERRRDHPTAGMRAGGVDAWPVVRWERVVPARRALGAQGDAEGTGVGTVTARFHWST